MFKMAPPEDADAVKAFYNNAQNFDAEFLKNESRIKGLRAFNNWVKYTLIHNFATIDSSQVTQTQLVQKQITDTASPKCKPPGLRVLDIGCGKGGDLQKWHRAPEKVAVYIGLDPAEVSVQQARERWEDSQKSLTPGKGVSRADFYTKDCFRESLENIPAIGEVGFDPGVGGGFDIVSMMFCMHYAFECETTVRMMLENITGALKSGGRLIGCVPSSKVIGQHIRDFESTVGALELGGDQPDVTWGNDIYNVRFLGKTPADGEFGKPFGHRYFFSLAEAVEAPEYVVPWDLFCEMAAEYGLRLQYCKPFDEVWEENRDDEVLAPLSKEMRVLNKGGSFLVSDQEVEAAKFYIAFCFRKI